MYRLILAALLLIAAPARAAEIREELVDAGSYRLFFRVLDGAGPVVLLESGGGLDSSEWLDLMPAIAESTGATVVAVDRPGFGKSDLPDLPCDIREESQSTWRALAELGLDQDVVVVGHSYGGWIARLHANDHPDQVIGLVLVDPFNCEFVDALTVEYCDQHPMMGKVPWADEDPATLTREQRALSRMVAGGLEPKMEVMRATRVPPGIPVRLLSSRQPFVPEMDDMKAWWAAHERVVASIPGAVLVEATGSGHMIPFDQPDLVLDAISDVVRIATESD